MRTITLKFETTADRDAHIARYFPEREATDTPGFFYLPDAETLGVNHLTVNHNVPALGAIRAARAVIDERDPQACTQMEFRKEFCELASLIDASYTNAEGEPRQSAEPPLVLFTDGQQLYNVRNAYRDDKNPYVWVEIQPQTV